jgi:predicted DNA-binding helix-hairpin-helix protein
MDVAQKLALSSQAGTWESDGHPSRAAVTPTGCGYTPAQLRRRYGETTNPQVYQIDQLDIYVHFAATPGGRRFPLLKALLTSACERACLYCPFRAGRDFRRVTFQPEELAKVFVRACNLGIAEGLFLSSGIFAGGENTQTKLIETAEILRRRLSFRGYLHLKVMPGASRDLVLHAMELSNRVSINLESPNPERLQVLAPQKGFRSELMQPIRWMEEIRRSEPGQHGWQGRWPSSTTQFVVGPAGESDLEILNTVHVLYSRFSLARAYFEAFNPVAGTPLEDYPPENETRQNRLYQASYLLRDYGFDLEELPFRSDGSLPLDRDPKRAYADQFLAESPLEVNDAEREMLIRIPGIGPRSASAILHARRSHRIRSMGQLRRLGAVAERAAPYITLDGQRGDPQRRLF